MKSHKRKKIIMVVVMIRKVCWGYECTCWN